MKYTNTVLIVDDSSMIVTMLSFMIKKEGYTVFSAEDGSKALELFNGREIDLMITDLNMPNVNGTELISEIRLKEYYRYIPVVLFSADIENEKNELMKSGATMLFDKKDIKGKIIPTIRKLLA